MNMQESEPRKPPKENAAKQRAAFAFPQRIQRFREGPQMCVLLWRILAIQPEVQDGRLRLLKQSFFRLWKEGEGDFTELSDRLTSNVAELVQKSGRHHLPNFMSFIMRVASKYRREQILLQDPAQRMAQDILFRTIQLISLNPTPAEAEQVIMEIGTHYPNSCITALDREILQRNFHAYQFLTKKILSLKSLRQALDLRDDIIALTSRKHPDVTIYNLDYMLRYIVAQLLLARKFRCDTLIVEWMQEYGFGPEEMLRIAKYIPYETSFLRFHNFYRQAIRNLKGYTPPSPEPEASDLYLLRSISIFYISWIMKTSEQLATA